MLPQDTLSRDFTSDAAPPRHREVDDDGPQYEGATVALDDTHPHKDRGRTITNPISAAAAPFLTRGVELSGLLTALVDAIVGQIGADRGTLYLVDGAARTLTSIVAHLPRARTDSARFWSRDRGDGRKFRASASR